MKERKIVLIDPESSFDPLYLEFKEDIHQSYEDLIVCEIPLDIAYAFLERQDGSYFDDHIHVPPDVAKYLEDLREEKETEKRMWKSVHEVEEVMNEMTKNKEKKGRK
ncbi:MAG: hypothetical protein ACI4VQ_06040 [Clostridia bacterium]